MGSLEPEVDCESIEFLGRKLFMEGSFVYQSRNRLAKTGGGEAA
jgi:hypothetical protein